MDDAARPFFRGLLAQPNCEGCPLKGSHIVPPEGNPRALVAIVGEGPGYQEVQESRPFVGPSGQLLNRILTAVGCDRSELWITNSALCKPKSVKVGDKMLSPDQVMKLSAEHCRSRLIAELRIVRPRVVVGLGTQSVRSVYDKTASMKGRRGGIHMLDLDQALADTYQDPK